MMIKNVQVVSVPVSNQATANDFYVDTLGFELRADRLWGEGACAGWRWSPRAPRPHFHSSHGSTLGSKSGETTLSGPVVDLAALHGLLTKVRDLGLPLLAVRLLDLSTVPSGREAKR